MEGGKLQEFKVSYTIQCVNLSDHKKCSSVPAVAEHVEALFLSFFIHGCAERPVPCCRSLKHQNSKIH